MTVAFPAPATAFYPLPPATTIFPDQLAALLALVADGERRTGRVLAFPGLGHLQDAAFTMEVDISPFSLTTLSACCDYRPDAIAIVEEALVRGVRIAIDRWGRGNAIRLSIASEPDACDTVPPPPRPHRHGGSAGRTPPLSSRPSPAAMLVAA